MIKRYLGKRLRDSARAKSFSREELERRTRNLVPPPRFETKPYTHQLATFLLGVKYEGFLDLLDMGLGKSKIILDLFAWRLAREDAKRALVLVPGVTNVVGWVDEAAVHQPRLMVQGITQSLKDKEAAALAGEYDVIVMTYAYWQILCCSMQVKKNGKGRERAPDDKRVNKFAELIDFVCYDESTALMNSRSVSFRIARKFLTRIRFRYALTGTPFDKDPASAWSQFFACDGGETLGDTLGIFRAGFFTEKRNHWSGYFDYVFRKDMLPQLRRRFRHRSVRYSEEECLDLPERIDRRVPVICPRENWKYYLNLKEQYKEAKGDRRLVESVYMQARQVIAGYLKIKQEDDEDVVSRFKHNPKLEALKELLQEIPQDERVLVFNFYHLTGALICDFLEKEKVDHLRLYGQTRNKEDTVRAFQAGKSRVLAVSSSGAKGLNLQVANHVIFFEEFDSAIAMAQAEKRIRRPGQTRRTHYYYLIMQGTVDERIHASTSESREFLAELIDGTTEL